MKYLLIIAVAGGCVIAQDKPKAVAPDDKQQALFWRLSAKANQAQVTILQANAAYQQAVADAKSAEAELAKLIADLKAKGCDLVTTAEGLSCKEAAKK